MNSKNEISQLFHIIHDHWRIVTNFFFRDTSLPNDFGRHKYEKEIDIWQQLIIMETAIIEQQDESYESENEMKNHFDINKAICIISNMPNT